MRIDENHTPFKLASDVAKNIKRKRITPHGITKITPFEAHMGRKANILLYKIATNSSPNNLNWENAKHACLDRKFLLHPPIPAGILHDLQKWSEDKVTIKRRNPEPALVKHTPVIDNNLRPNTGVKTGRTLDIEKEKLNVRSKGIQQQVEPKMKKE